MYVCMHARMHACMHACMYVCMYYVCMYVCVCVCIYVFMYVCMYIHVSMSVHMCMSLRLYIYVCKHIYTNTLLEELPGGLAQAWLACLTPRHTACPGLLEPLGASGVSGFGLASACFEVGQGAPESLVPVEVIGPCDGLLDLTWRLRKLSSCF